MAWYRAGGGGIPSSLKTGMNSVLNKKFGTATTYDPACWPDDVNLMGPLPEKTASGAIASFSDGADDVPLKSLVFGIEPVQASGTPSPSNPLPISGHTSLTGVHCGKNLWDEVTELGGISATTGENTVDNNILRSKNYIQVVPNTSMTWVCESNSSAIYSFYGYDRNKAFVGTISNTKPFTIPSNVYYIRFRLYAVYGTTYLNDIAINYPSTATTYAPYSAESKKWDWSEL